MAIPSRQIGWGTEENLLWQISKQLEYLSGITYNSGGGGSGSGTNGTSGVSGTSGLTGDNGTAGVSGTAGTSGATGTNGVSGTSGESGTSGISGTSGTSASINSTGGNVDTLGGVAMRTLYSRTNVINYSVGTEADLMSGSSNFGSRNFPTQFFTDSVNYIAKTIHFRVTGKWGTVVTPNTSAVITTTFGTSVIATSTNILDFSSNKPCEIFGEITITNGLAVVCYSVGWCDQTGDFRRQPISDPSTPVNISAFTGGDFKVLLGSATNNSFTSYLGYIQVWN